MHQMSVSGYRQLVCWLPSMNTPLASSFNHVSASAVSCICHRRRFLDSVDTPVHTLISHDNSYLSVPVLVFCPRDSLSICLPSHTDPRHVGTTKKDQRRHYYQLPLVPRPSTPSDTGTLLHTLQQPSFHFQFPKHERVCIIHRTLQICHTIKFPIPTNLVLMQGTQKQTLFSSQRTLCILHPFCGPRYIEPGRVRGE